MAVAKLSKVSVIVPRSEVPIALRELSEFGMFHPSQPHSESYDPKLDSLATTAFRIHIALGEIVRDAGLKIEPGLIEVLTKGYHVTKEKFTVSDWEDLVEKIESDSKPIIDETGKALSIVAEAEKKILTEKALVGALRLVSEFSIDFKLFASMRRFHIVFAIVTSKDLVEIKKSLPEAIVVDSPLTKTASAVLVGSAKSDADLVGKVLRSFEVEPFTIPLDLPQNPAEAYEVVGARATDTQRNLAEASQKLLEIVTNNENRILALYEVSKNAHQVLHEMRRSGDLKRMAILQGYIPNAGEHKFTESFGRWITVTEEVHPSHGHGGHGGEHEVPEVPTLMTNPGPTSAFEMVVMNQGAPRYGEIDPTIITSVVFPIFYGIMFGDLGHGIVLLLFGLLLIQRKALGLFKWGTMLVLAGITSSIVGILIGEVFGLEIKNYIPALGQLMQLELVERLHNGVPLRIPTISITSLKLVLKIAIDIGIIHLLVGNITAVVNDIRAKATLELIAERLPTLAMYIGFIFVLFSFLSVKFKTTALFSETATRLFFFFEGPPVAVSTTLGIALLVGPLFVYVVAKPVFISIGKLPKESVGMAAMQNLIEGMFEKIPGFLSNTVSYARLAVLLAVHASLLIALNLAWNMPFSMGIPLIIICNVLIIMLEGLIVYIQDLRLHLYEWFTKFYSGTGVAFRRLMPDSTRSEIDWKKQST